MTTSPPPAWFKGYRPGQEQAVEEVIGHFNDGVKVVFLEAPTGSGKTIIADQVRRGFAPNSTIYTCTTKTLQMQVAKDFKYANVLWGRNNYRTLNGAEWITAADCTSTETMLPACSECDPDKEGMAYHCYWCFPEDTQVEWPDLVAPMRRDYEGELVEITTTRGYKLSGTPNHPILTNRGWVELGDLIEGDCVISRSRGKEPSLGDPDIENMPATIGEVFDTFPVSARITDERVSGVDVDFDVQGPESKIKVVSEGRLLENRIGPSFGKPRGHLSFSGTGPMVGVVESGKGLSVHGAVASVTAPPGGVRSSSVPFSFPGSELRHTVGLGLTAGTEDNSLITQPLGDIGFASADELGKGNYRLPFEVEPDEIVGIKRKWFTGHVYNLQTEQEWYVANNIVAHNCHPTSDCPYRLAREDAQHSELPVLNFAYLLTVLNGPGWFKNRKLIVIDEADALEENAMGMIEVEFTSKMLDDLRIGPPPLKTVPKSWYDWAISVAIPALEREIGRLEASIGAAGEHVDVKELGKLNRFSTVLGNLVAATHSRVRQDDGESLSELEAEWVYSQYDTKYGTKLSFRPVKVQRAMPELLWPHAQHFLLMSATIISAQQMAEDLGLEPDEWAYVSMASSFPIERRPVFVEPAGSMTMKTEGTGEWEKVTEATARLIEDNPGVRILVHTVSYKLTRLIEEAVERYAPSESHRVFSYMNAGERLRALDGYLARPDGVLLASSFQRGVDLHEDACRVIVIPKVPFPFLGDSQVKKRLFGGGQAGERWYQMVTVRTICQMTGRGMRSAEDFCETYILDQQFTRIWREQRYLFPRWWADAVVLDRNDPKFRKGREAL